MSGRGGSKNKPPRFALPDNWDVSDTWCVVLRVPADEQYVQMLIGHLSELTYSRLFARDDTHSGAAAVARTWSRALDDNVIVVNENCEGVEGMGFSKIRFRLKPGAPWVQQWKYDDEDTWYDGAMYPHYPVGDFKVDPVGDAQDAQQKSADIVQGLYQWLAQRILALHGDGIVKLEAVNAIMGEMAPYAVDPVAARVAVNEVWDGLTDLPTPTANEYYTEEGFEEHYAGFWQRQADLFEQYPANYTDELGNFLQDEINNTADNVLKGMHKTALALGGGILNFAQKFKDWFTGEFPGFALTWAHTIDLTITDGDFVPNAIVLGGGTVVCPAARHEMGTGWIADADCTDEPSHADNHLCQLNILRKLKKAFYTSVDVEMEIADGFAYGEGVRAVTLRYEGAQIGQTLTGVSNGFSGTTTVDGPSPVDFSDKLDIYCGANNDQAWKITEVTFHGRGYNPFAPDF